MAKVTLNKITVHNVQPCPKCSSEIYAHVQSPLNISSICCDKCDYEVSGGFMLKKGIDDVRNPKEYIEFTRLLFNAWNEGVAKEKGIEAKRVRIVKNV